MSKVKPNKKQKNKAHKMSSTISPILNDEGQTASIPGAPVNGNRGKESTTNGDAVKKPVATSYPKLPQSTGKIVTEEMMVNVGPQHPSTHGVFRAMVTVDGEVVTKLEPHIGYLHRCFEKLAENRTYEQFMPYTERLDYISGMLSNWAYALAVEKLAGITVPERAEHLRVIMGELNRISSHLIYYSTAGMDTGALTPFFWMFEDREMILDLFEEVCGARQTFNYIRIGGVSADIPDGWTDGVLKFFEHFEKHLVDLEAILLGNSIFKQRMIGVGQFPSKAALRMGAVGPCIRASGIPADVRRTDPYSIYDRFEFDIPVGKNGDNYDRTLVRFEEIHQSIKIIKQALDHIPNGPIMANVPRLLCPPEGMAFAHIESSKGDLGFFIVSDGSPKPYRLKIQGPSYANLQAFPAIAKNSYVADMITILGTLDPVFGEVDR